MCGRISTANRLQPVPPKPPPVPGTQASYCLPEQISHAIRTLLQVSQVVCNTPAVLAGLALLQSGGDFADGVIAFEGELLGGQEFVTFDQAAAKLLKHQKRKVRLLKTG